MQLRRCKCCQRLIVLVWWAEEKRWVQVLLADSSGGLIFDGNPLYDRTTQTIHATPWLTRVREARKDPKGRKVRGVLEKIGPPASEDKEDRG